MIREKSETGSRSVTSDNRSVALVLVYGNMSSEMRKVLLTASVVSEFFVITFSGFHILTYCLSVELGGLNICSGGLEIDHA